MGFQREMASRGSLAMYTSVRLPHLFCFHGSVTHLGRICCCARVYRLSDNANVTIDRWGDYYHGHGRLRFRNIPSYILTQLNSCSCPHQLTKQATARPANDVRIEQESGATPAHGDDREAR